MWIKKGLLGINSNVIVILNSSALSEFYGNNKSTFGKRKLRD